MVNEMEKRVLGAIFCLRLSGSGSTLALISKRLGVESKCVVEVVDRLEARRHVKKLGKAIVLTSEGRKAIKVVFIGGGFEVIHRGHLYTIEKARGLGDLLVVSVARDSTIKKRKGRSPVAEEKDRARLVSSLKSVDLALLGVEGDIYTTLERVKPDIVALGYDQYHLEEDIEKEAQSRGLNLRVVRLDSPFPKIKTSALLNET